MTRASKNATKETGLTYRQHYPVFSAGELSQPEQPGHRGPQVSPCAFFYWWNLQFEREAGEWDWKAGGVRLKKLFGLTWGKSLNSIRLNKDLGNKRCVAVVNFLLEFQLWPCNILGMKQSEHLKTAARAWTLMRESKDCISQKLILARPKKMSST